MKTIDYKTDLYKRLKDNSEYALGYLNLALNDEDPRILFLAIRDIIEARSSISTVAQVTGLNREHIYRMLSQKGNPSMINILKLLNALGLSLKASHIKHTIENEFPALTN